jgi:hypothetical protein
MGQEQLKALMLLAAFIEARTEGKAAVLDKLAEEAQLLLDRAILFERQGFPEMAALLRQRAREVMSADLDAALPPSNLQTPAIPFAPPEKKPPALPGQALTDPPKRPRGRPRRQLPPPEEPTNAESNPAGWDHV